MPGELPHKIPVEGVRMFGRCQTGAKDQWHIDVVTDTCCDAGQANMVGTI